ncbi:hypothetical protein [Dokdonella sp.]|uniref:ATP-grasp domain-containing protein n=1 Tax=Dokdonella sp. TaxID=2291710 RepID=UPI0025C5ADC5|nr:hypothetical protein [Dokdonella sp.]MBX3689111.1 hypothetical protein [Dokdonella sp.]
MTHIALVSVQAARPLDDDLAPLTAAFQAEGVNASIVDWDDPQAEWTRFDAAVLRSTWDYSERLPEFLAWAARVAAQTRLFNPFEVVRWNTDKHYLAALERAGVAIVPSLFVEPDESPLDALARFLAAYPLAEEFVIKPCVGAGSRDAQRHRREHREGALVHLARLLDAGRSVLMQPYLATVDDRGETALIHFDGQFSHAIRKGALLLRGEGPTQELFAPEQITPRVPSEAERALALRAVAAIPFAGPFAYARVDLIHGADGAPRLLELELAEPSLFFDHAPGSAQRFARVILAHITA